MSQSMRDKLITVAWGADIICAIVLLVRSIQTFNPVFIGLALALAIIGKLVAPMIPIPESARARGYTHEYFSGKRRSSGSKSDVMGEPALPEAGTPMSDEAVEAE